MNILHRNAFLILLLIFPQAKSSKEFCNDISLSCQQKQLVITSVSTTTTNLAKTILEQCNSKRSCLVNNPNEECVQLEHGCRGKMQTVEIKEYVRQDVHSSSFNLMSFGYQEGKYMSAQQLNCTLTFTENAEITVIINEFAPYTVTKDFCFKVEGTKEQPFCSGSARLNTIYGKFAGKSQWKFGMDLAAGAKDVPKVRFWINIVPQNHNCSLECRAKPVTNKSGHLSFVTNIIYVVGGILGLLLLFAFGFCVKSPCCRARQYNVAQETIQNSCLDIEAAAWERLRNQPAPNQNTSSLVSGTLQAMLPAGYVYNLSQTSTLRNDSNLQEIRFVQNDPWNQDDEEEMCDDVEIIDNAIYA